MCKAVIALLLTVSVALEGRAATHTADIAADDSTVVIESKVFDVVDKMPTFPGGVNALQSFLARNIRFPAVAEENGVQGRVVVLFIVEEDGSISDVKVARGEYSSIMMVPSPDDPKKMVRAEPDAGSKKALEREAIRVVQFMPRWIPGEQNGKSVRVQYTLPVSFRL